MKGAPGVQWAWTEGGEVRTEAAGWAEWERRAMSTGTPMMAYSMSKVVTAWAVTVLARAGALGVDDRVERYLPGWGCGEATVRQLLEHRSGLTNPIPLRWVHLREEHAGFDEAAALAAVWERHGRGRCAPTGRRVYSNLGYWLLGRVVETAAGRPFARFVEEDVLRPMGIGPAEVGYAYPEDGSQAAGYLERWSWMNLLRPVLTDPRMTAGREGPWIRMRDHYVNGPAFGGCIGTAAGFCRFARRMWEDGDGGYGWEERDGFVEKEGGGAGFRCLLRLDRGSGRVWVVIGNGAGGDVRGEMARLGAG